MKSHFSNQLQNKLTAITLMFVRWPHGRIVEKLWNFQFFYCFSCCNSCNTFTVSYFFIKIVWSKLSFCVVRFQTWIQFSPVNEISLNFPSDLLQLYSNGSNLERSKSRGSLWRGRNCISLHRQSLASHYCTADVVRVWKNCFNSQQLGGVWGMRTFITMLTSRWKFNAIFSDDLLQNSRQSAAHWAENKSSSYQHSSTFVVGGIRRANSLRHQSRQRQNRENVSASSDALLLSWHFDLYDGFILVFGVWDTEQNRSGACWRLSKGLWTINVSIHV